MDEENEFDEMVYDDPLWFLKDLQRFNFSQRDVDILKISDIEETWL